ncbi:MAG: BspA family leucine-rich repeat surface protein [Saprospiraceae bacterium]|nr:BspA family leucine-rich repeat surface protein [Saprospiraceae bacterium]
MRIPSFLCCFLSGMMLAGAQSPFLTTWKTDNPGSSAPNQIIIPGTGDNYFISWEESGNPQNNGIATGNGMTTITLPNPGTYQVAITPGAGTFHQIRFAFSGDCLKLLSVDQWGDILWSTMEKAFEGCMNLQCTATDIPDLSAVSVMDGMFGHCSILNGPSNIGAWDVGAVTSMNYLFWGAARFNQPIGTWNTENVTSMEAMFSGATEFNQPIGDWMTGKVTSMKSMFLNASWFNQNINNWNTTQVTTFEQMFAGATSFNQPVGAWNTGKAATLKAMFSHASSFNQPIGSWNTSQVTDFGRMFAGAYSFDQPIGGWNTGNAIDLSEMFRSAHRFNQDIGQWNTGQVISMRSMFRDALAFNQDIGHWNTGNVTSMGGMFQNATHFNKDLRFWNTEKVTDMASMFSHATSFNQDIAIWHTGNVMDMSGMFSNAHAFNQVIGQWTLHPKVNMSAMLDSCGMDCGRYSSTLDGWSLQPALPDSIHLGAAGRFFGTNLENTRSHLIQIRGWTIIGDALSGDNCSHRPFITVWKTDYPGMSDSLHIQFPGIGMDYSIYWEEEGHPDNRGHVVGHDATLISFPHPGRYSIRVIPGSGSFHRFRTYQAGDRQKLLSIDQWGDISWTSMENAFFGCQNLQCQAQDLPDLSGLTSIAGMFNACTSLTGPENIHDWNVAHITDMKEVFHRAVLFNQPIGKWNTQSATRMTSMFHDANSFNQPIGDWDVGQVTDMGQMFHAASNFNQPLNNWNTSNVVSMSGMFWDASAFNQPIGNWNTSKVTDMSYMFLNATAFNQPLGDWNTSNVTDMSSMFYNATAFNQPLGDWVYYSVKNMDGMFWNATQFNESVGNWSTEQVESMSYMFYNAVNFNHPSIKFINTQPLKTTRNMFQNASSFNQDLKFWNTHGLYDMREMFRNATSFNQNLGDWNLNQWAYMEGMLDGSGMDCDHYSATLTGWNAQPSAPLDVHLGADGLQYGLNAQEARDQLIHNKGWTITGDAPSSTNCGLSSSMPFPHEDRRPFLQVWPNPASDLIHFNFPATHALIHASIYNAQGLEVRKFLLDPGNGSLDIGSLPPGHYLLRVFDSAEFRWAPFSKM